jgi:hypothetical protein
MTMSWEGNELILQNIPSTKFPLGAKLVRCPIAEKCRDWECMHAVPHEPFIFGNFDCTNNREKTCPRTSKKCKEIK